MKVDIIVPAAGESVTEADIASWSKETGDFVEMDDVCMGMADWPPMVGRQSTSNVVRCSKLCIATCSNVG